MVQGEREKDGHGNATIAAQFEKKQWVMGTSAERMATAGADSGLYVAFAAVQFSLQTEDAI